MIVSEFLLLLFFWLITMAIVLLPSLIFGNSIIWDAIRKGGRWNPDNWFINIDIFIRFLPANLLAIISTIIFAYLLFIKKYSEATILLGITAVLSIPAIYLSFKTNSYIEKNKEGKNPLKKCPCPFCNRNISVDSQECKYCGQRFTKQDFKY